MDLSTNIFPIANLAELSSAYRVYRVRGLRQGQPDFFKNREMLVRRLSYALQSPVAAIDIGGESHLAVQTGGRQPPSSYVLVRTPVHLDAVGDVRNLDYTLRSADNDLICLRFINFMLQAPLRAKNTLWQFSSGKPFYSKRAAESLDNLLRYEGFAVRAVVTADGGIGLCVDVRSSFIARDSLPITLSRNDFRRFKGKNCLYRMGHDWYSVQLTALSDMNVSEFVVPLDGQGTIPLVKYVQTKSRKPMPPELANLDPRGAVVHYRTNRDEDRAAPAGLCHLIFDTETREVQRHFRATILAPGERHRRILGYATEHLRELSFGGATLRLAEQPLGVAQRIFAVPDLEFGRDQKLSVAGTPGARQVGLDNLGRRRFEMLTARDVGFYVSRRLDRQYLLLPQSVADSWGRQFVDDIKKNVNELYPEGAYQPIVVAYDDRVDRTFVEQGKAILEAARANCTQAGYTLVMIHSVGRRSRDHDRLAAMVIREFRKLQPGIRAAVSHSEMGQESYAMVTTASGDPVYRVRDDRRGRFVGYLRNVALSKILLTNERWPFVLATPLNADVVVGIDVKNNTAGFTVVSGNGSQIRTMCDTSRQKEKLLPEQIRAYLVDIVRDEFAVTGRAFKSLVLHRDGRLFGEEQEGAKAAVAQLKADGTLTVDATLTMLEISKTEPAPLRLFEVTQRAGAPSYVSNPQVGCYYMMTASDAYLCSTGRPFQHPGTSKPLHIRFLEGGLPFEACLEDIYRLTVLAWTKPDDCSRVPITIRMTDRALGEDATEYDEDALRFGTPEVRKVSA
jgi:hypothetical protein